MLLGGSKGNSLGGLGRGAKERGVMVRCAD
jgi:hypothetical protein